MEKRLPATIAVITIFAIEIIINVVMKLMDLPVDTILG